MALQYATRSVSVGMPVFNGERTIRVVIESLLHQSFQDFELIISDNCSTDNTSAICKEYAAKDDRIRYVRQVANIGAEANFNFVLAEATGRYFMWAAADDIRSSDFLEVNLRFLEENPDYAASTLRVKFEGQDFDAQRMGDRSLEMEEPGERMVDFFGKWHANGSFYSLMRTNLIKQCPWNGIRFLGADWVIVLFLAKHGKLKRHECGFVELGTKGVSNSGNIFRLYRGGIADYFFPFWRQTVAVMSLSADLPILYRMKILVACLKMHVRAFKVRGLVRLCKLYKCMKSITEKLFERKA